MSHSTHANAEEHAVDHGSEEAHEPVGLDKSERYELEDLFQGESPENQHFLKIAGIVILVALLFLALAYPFFFR
jgi:hypothetical protein